MPPRSLLFPFIILTCVSSGAFSQTNNLSVLQSRVRALTVGELSAVAEKADSGDTDSQVLLGLSLGLLAERVRDDKAQEAFYDSSLFWLRKAAEKGGAREQYLLAKADLGLPYTWHQLELNSKEASAMLKKAIAQNYAPAMTALGHWYMEGGRYLDVDYTLGMEWLNKASLAGDPEANYWIGDAYENGRGARRDQREANRWFLKGAELGDGDCQDTLAVNLAEGNGTPKDVKEAVNWFRKSAEGGNVWGTCNLGLHYMRGEGVPKDYVLSLMWGLISDGVNTGGYYCLQEIDVRPLLNLTKEQEMEATKRANAWLKEHHYPPVEAPTHDNPPSTAPESK